MRWLGRLVLLRFLPRRLVPLLAAWEVVNVLRGTRRKRRVGDVAAPARGPAARRPPVP